MLPYPVEITDHQSGRDFSLLPQLAKLVLTTMPTPSLLSDNPVGSLNPLRLILANDMGDLRCQDSFVARPAIGIPNLSIRFPFGTGNQFSDQLIGVFAHSGTQN